MKNFKMLGIFFLVVLFFGIFIPVAEAVKIKGTNPDNPNCHIPGLLPEQVTACSSVLNQGVPDVNFAGATVLGALENHTEPLTLHTELAADTEEFTVDPSSGSNEVSFHNKTTDDWTGTVPMVAGGSGEYHLGEAQMEGEVVTPPPCPRPLNRTICNAIGDYVNSIVVAKKLSGGFQETYYAKFTTPDIAVAARNLARANLGLTWAVNLVGKTKAQSQPTFYPNEETAKNGTDQPADDVIAGRKWSQQLIDMKFYETWDAQVPTGGRADLAPIIVAVIDSGLDEENTDIQDKIWINHLEIPADVNNLYPLNPLPPNPTARQLSDWYKTNHGITDNSFKVYEAVAEINSTRNCIRFDSAASDLDADGWPCDILPPNFADASSNVYTSAPIDSHGHGTMSAGLLVASRDNDSIMTHAYQAIAGLGPQNAMVMVIKAMKQEASGLTLNNYDLQEAIAYVLGKRMTANDTRVVVVGAPGYKEPPLKNVVWNAFFQKGIDIYMPGPDDAMVAAGLPIQLTAAGYIVVSHAYSSKHDAQGKPVPSDFVPDPLTAEKDLDNLFAMFATGENIAVATTSTPDLSKPHLVSLEEGASGYPGPNLGYERIAYATGNSVSAVIATALRLNIDATIQGIAQDAGVPYSATEINVWQFAYNKWLPMFASVERMGNFRMLDELTGLGELNVKRALDAVREEWLARIDQPIPALRDQSDANPDFAVVASRAHYDSTGNDICYYTDVGLWGGPFIYNVTNGAYEYYFFYEDADNNYREFLPGYLTADLTPVQGLQKGDRLSVFRRWPKSQFPSNIRKVGAIGNRDRCVLLNPGCDPMNPANGPRYNELAETEPTFINGPFSNRRIRPVYGNNMMSSEIQPYPGLCGSICESDKKSCDYCNTCNPDFWWCTVDNNGDDIPDNCP